MTPERLARLRRQAEAALGPECGAKYEVPLGDEPDGPYWQQTCHRPAGHEAHHGQGRPIGAVVPPAELIALLDAVEECDRLRAHAAALYTELLHDPDCVGSCPCVARQHCAGAAYALDYPQGPVS